MKNKTFILTIIFLPVIIILGFTLLKCIQSNKNLKKSLPYLTVDESSEYFTLIGMDENIVDRSVLKKEHPSLIFIFSRPCSPCNKNIIFWKKMAEVLKDKVTIYGIIIDSFSNAYNFYDKARLNFKIYIPADIKQFIEKWRLKLNYPQTAIYQNRIKFIKLGDLTSSETIKIIKMVRKML